MSSIVNMTMLKQIALLSVPSDTFEDFTRFSTKTFNDVKEHFDYLTETFTGKLNEIYERINHLMKGYDSNFDTLAEKWSSTRSELLSMNGLVTGLQMKKNSEIDSQLLALLDGDYHVRS